MTLLFLLGYMGSGKSSIAKLLSQRLRISFKDLDDCVENETQMSINSIFETKGEIWFRKKEHDVFKELMVSSESFVLALGGGTPCYANNHELLKWKSVVSVYLKTSVETLCERLSDEKSARPLIAGKNPQELQDFIAQHLFERSYYYNHATHTVSTDGKSPSEIVTAIENLLV